MMLEVVIFVLLIKCMHLKEAKYRNYIQIDLQVKKALYVTSFQQRIPQQEYWKCSHAFLKEACESALSFFLCAPEQTFLSLLVPCLAEAKQNGMS